MLQFIHTHITSTLLRSSDDFQEYLSQLEVERKENQSQSPRQSVQKYQKLYDDIYPGFFSNSFFISACALFEYQMKSICDLVMKEYEVPFTWDDMEGSPPLKTKRFLRFGGIVLKDNAPDSFEHWFSTIMPDQINLPVKELWQELENYFMVRNCLAHHAGLVKKLRYPRRVREYAVERGVLLDKEGKLEIRLNQKFNIEVCKTMSNLIEKLTSAYYALPLPG